MAYAEVPFGLVLTGMLVPARLRELTSSNHCLQIRVRTGPYASTFLWIQGSLKLNLMCFGGPGLEHSVAILLSLCRAVSNTKSEALAQFQ